MKPVFTYGTPEDVGISSKDILNLINEFQEAELYTHSLMIVKNGKIVTEAYWKPFDKDFRHRMYSVSKSFVAGAIGLLCEEGKIKLTDKVCKYFPEYPEETLHPYTRDTTIRDLMIMATPFELTYALYGNGRNVHYWVESFFTAKPNKPSGTVFCYDTTASFMLDVLVERITGKPFMDYLYDKILYKLDFSENVKCIKSPDGFSWGGSGVLCTTLDLAKYAYIYLKGGKVNGEQLLPEEFVKDAIAKQIESDTFGLGGNVYTTVGYGYQIWRTEDNGFAFNGMGNQHAFCYPDKDLMVILTSDNQGKQPDAIRVISSAIKRNLLNKCNKSSIEENKAAFQELTKKIESLSLMMPKGERRSECEKKIDGVTYKLIDNPMKWEWVRFSFGEKEGTMYYKNERGEKSLKFGYGEYVEGELPETHYSGDTIGTPLGRGYKYLGAGVWPEETHLLLRFNVVDDYIGNCVGSFAFTGDRVGFRLSKTAEGFLDGYEGLAGGDAM